MLLRAWRLWLLIALVAAAGYWVFVPAGEPATDTYEWRFSERMREDVPHTRVTLVAKGRSYDLGEYRGTCSVEEGEYLEYEKSKAVCWYAGGGHELGVFEEPGQVVVRAGEIDEGASGIAGVRGNFKLVERIK